MYYSLDISKPVSCRMAGRMRQSNGWEHNGMTSPANNLVFIISGSASFNIDGSVYDCSRGSVIIIPRGAYYTVHTDDTCEYFFFHFSGVMEKSDSAFFSRCEVGNFSFTLPTVEYKKLYLFCRTEANDSFDSLFVSVLSCLEHASSGTACGRYMLDNEFFYILLMLYGLAEQHSVPAGFPALVSKVMSYIKKNITAHLSLSDICEEHKISASYTARVFKRYTGMTVGEYINKEKMYYAKELICRSSMNLSEIADYLSFCDVFYFSKLFKKTFGISPSKFRSTLK